MYFTTQDIQKRRERVSAAWDHMLKNDEAVLLRSGEPVQKPGGLDQTYPFLPNPSYYWLTGRRRETEVLLYSRNSGWVEFQKEISAEEAVWEGERHDLLVEEKGRDIRELESFLARESFAKLYDVTHSPVEPGKAFELKAAMDKERRKKDASEIKLIKQLAEVALHGYRKIEEMMRPGVTEKEIGIAYEAEIFRHGAHTVPYESIVGSGPNSAILHFPPTHKVIKENEFVLVDAGADIYDYCVDITRTYFSSGKMSGQNKDLYQLVLKVQQECIAMSKAGVQWHDVHNHAARVTTEGLLGLGILKGNLSNLIEKEVAYVFFPHGVGHLVGLRVRDTGQEENLQPKKYFGARLRVDLELEENHLITVEPGCYFIKPLLDSPDIQARYKDDINWTEVEKWKNIGGVRIEDNILIKKDGNENLTEIVPKIE